ncbi:MAG: ABC transporter ATP-binding protein [Eubacteriales bacterium]|nr:ABC transporter ATP-binding protein [Eubacteriales bacterium]
MENVLSLEKIGYSYGDNRVLKGVDAGFERGKIYAIVGKSGAGKTTLLSVMAALTRPQEGKIFWHGQDVTAVDPYEYRSKEIGVIFQDFNLLTQLTAVENVELSLELSKVNGKEKYDRKALQEKAYRVLESVGIGRELADHRVLKLSGGQRQRVAIARAISYDSDIVLADEPTGNLDGETQIEIMDVFEKLAAQGKCVIIVTHSDYVALRASEKLVLRDGHLIDEKDLQREADAESAQTVATTVAAHPVGTADDTPESDALDASERIS